MIYNLTSPKSERFRREDLFILHAKSKKVSKNIGKICVIVMLAAISAAPVHLSDDSFTYTLVLPDFNSNNPVNPEEYNYTYDFSALDGVDADTSLQWLDDMNIDSNVTYDYSNTVPEGYFISSNFPEDYVINDNFKFSAVVSKGKEFVKIGDFTGHQLSEIQALLAEHDLSCKVTEVYDDYTEQGEVMLQDVEEGTSVRKGSIIPLTVSKGTDKIKMPDLRGLTKDEAFSALSKAGLSYKTENVYLDTVNIGSIASQSYKPDALVPPHETVILKLCAGTADGKEAKILNSSILSPVATGFDPCDQLVGKVISEITTDDMTTYGKTKAIYDYLINNCVYGFNARRGDYPRAFGGGQEYEARAYGMLTGHIGACNDYSAAFWAMTRYIGLDTHIVYGQTHRAGGGYTGHYWCETIIDGTTYVFDPQVEDNMTRGTIKYDRFCKTYDEMPGKYIYYSNDN